MFLFLRVCSRKLTRVFLQSVLISSHHDGRNKFNMFYDRHVECITFTGAIYKIYYLVAMLNIFHGHYVESIILRSPY